jgi:hypothetical protein
MGVPVVLTPQSQKDLGEIVSFIARDNPNRAVQFGDALVSLSIRRFRFKLFQKEGALFPNSNWNLSES